MDEIINEIFSVFASWLVSLMNFNSHSIDLVSKAHYFYCEYHQGENYIRAGVVKNKKKI
jgi:hypothetical protein